MKLILYYFIVDFNVAFSDILSISPSSLLLLNNSIPLHTWPSLPIIPFSQRMPFVVHYPFFFKIFLPFPHQQSLFNFLDFRDAPS